jgi:DNA-binding HxlR family transcriptional regulator
VRDPGSEPDAGKGRPHHAGRPIPSCRQWTPLGRALTVAADNWTLLIAAQMAEERVRLTELRSRLAGVSAGVIDRYLHQMVQAGLMTRQRFREKPPRVELELTDAGRELLPIAAALARWGLRHAWSEPHAGEQVDVEALLRAFPMLLGDGLELQDMAIELILAEGEQESRHRFALRGGTLRRATEQERDPGPSAAVRGDRGAWKDAFGPIGDTAQLRISGEEEPARRLLAALHERAAAR